MGDGGKGSTQRPLGVDQKTFEENWDAIFGDCGGAQHSTEDKLVDTGEKANDIGRQTEQ